MEVAGYLVERVSPKAGATGDESADGVRRMLASIPIERLRDAGLLDQLVRLAGNGDGASAQSDDSSAAIDEMGIDDLVRMTFEAAS